LDNIKSKILDGMYLWSLPTKTGLEEAFRASRCVNFIKSGQFDRDLCPRRRFAVVKLAIGAASTIKRTLDQSAEYGKYNDLNYSKDPQD